MSKARDLATVASRSADTKPGTIAHFASAAAPDGWLPCDGGSYSAALYPALFTILGTVGQSTFNTPDLRGEFIRGLDNGRGVDSGRTLRSSQTDAFQGHTMGSAANQRVTVLGSYASAGVTGTGGVYTENLGTGTIISPQADGTNGTPRTSTETRPRNVAMLACIKF
jgi:microcystin-dependent protein